VVIVGDLIEERLEQARSFGCKTVDVSKGDPKDQIAEILGVLNSIMDVTRAAGKLGIPGLYVTGNPGAVDDDAREGSLSIRIGLGWAKSQSIATGQCPVMRYHHGLMQMLLNDKAQIAKAVNATVIRLDEAPRRLPGLRQGRGKKSVIDPHRMVKA
jgi:glutathione-independent formaldehyde dehydrogenase